MCNQQVIPDLYVYFSLSQLMLCVSSIGVIYSFSAYLAANLPLFMGPGSGRSTR